MNQYLLKHNDEVVVDTTDQGALQLYLAGKLPMEEVFKIMAHVNTGHRAVWYQGGQWVAWRIIPAIPNQPLHGLVL